MGKPRRAPRPSEAIRLVKTWLPATLVREMDQTILASNGSYNGRDDFIKEAISDRLAEERSRPDRAPASVVRLHATSKRTDKRAAEKGQVVGGSQLLEPQSWSGKPVPTLAPQQVGGILYGLHNRDYPTLWAVRSLLAMSSERGSAIPWSDFTAAVLEAAWNVGAQLAKMDAERAADEQKASVGFPINPEKRRSSEARFLEHMVGVADRARGPTGPIFAMKLAGVNGVGEALVIAPTGEAIALWDRLVAAGFGSKDRPPHVPAAWDVFREHLRSQLSEDFDAWMRVLRAIDSQPTREELIEGFAREWAGAAAATNVAGYVSRGREWGLIAGKLQNGRYVLTEVGRTTV